MGSFEKYLEKIQQRPMRTDIGFDETYTFLTSKKVGFKAVDNGGSHCKFRKDGKLITIPRKNLKGYTIRQILEVLDELDII